MAIHPCVKYGMPMPNDQKVMARIRIYFFEGKRRGDINKRRYEVNVKNGIIQWQIDKQNY